MSSPGKQEDLLELLNGGSAHASFEDVVEGFPASKRGERPDGLAYTAWELLEHMRIAQADILAFCKNPSYEAPDWPDEYWPPSPEPPTNHAWKESIAAFQQDLDEIRQLIGSDSVDLHAEIPHGDGQTYFREVLLVADHNAYHLGQMVALRRLLGIWPPS